jgi:hypothetical protein
MTPESPIYSVDHHALLEEAKKVGDENARMFLEIIENGCPTLENTTRIDDEEEQPKRNDSEDD